MQVARHYYRGGDIQDKCFIFPNRRSMVFFRKYLSDLVRQEGRSPLRMPPTYTVNDFFCHLYGAEVTDRLRLLTRLYSLYVTLYPKAEPLDRFIFWGDVMLGDFDDVDKYLVDARALFKNVSEFKEIQDDYSYISENQRKAISAFLSHFKDSGPSDGEKVIKSRFLGIWNILLPLYEGFRESLRKDGLAYEGMVYRDLADRLVAGESAADILGASFPGTGLYVFVGLNALNECERTLLGKMRDARLAEFVWDYYSEQIRDEANKSSFFMKKNIQDFPQAFAITAGDIPEITVVSVPSSTSQAKLAPRILKETEGDPVETAFILPDESLLLPLLNSIPPEYDSVNVTMGYPMKGSALYTLITTAGRMQLRLRKREDGWYFYHREVREIFSSSLFSMLLSEQEKQCVSEVRRQAKHYIPMKDLQGGEVMKMVFRPVVQDIKNPSADQNLTLCRYLSEITGKVGRAVAGEGEMLLELDFAKRLHGSLNILEDTPLDVLPQTWLSVLDGILGGISVPFRGEPLKGLQIMGPLETRALDFKNVVILSANEGMFPRRSVSSSFIPPELRRGFGLPTYEFQDAVWAYYFYRLLQRASKVWMVYDSRTEGLNTGEESRYIKQLEYGFGIKVKRIVAGSKLETIPAEGDIPKTQADVDIIRSGHLSATALKSYLNCPAQFYYQVVKNLESSEDIAESMDSGMIGRVFHKAMQDLYSGKETVTAAHIDAMLADSKKLHALVRAGVLKEMHSVEVSGRNLVTEQIILDYVKETLRHDRQLLRESGSQGFRIIGLEQFREIAYDGIRIIGFLDRIDSYIPGQVRIVDYKTGKVEDDDINITDDNAAEVADKLFGSSNDRRPSIALQLFIYGQLAHSDPSLKGQAIVNSIYSTGSLFTDPLQDRPENQMFVDLVKERLSAMLKEITDVSVPFHRTNNANTCKWCDFKTICGR